MAKAKTKKKQAKAPKTNAPKAVATKGTKSACPKGPAQDLTTLREYMTVVLPDTVKAAIVDELMAAQVRFIVGDTTSGKTYRGSPRVEVASFRGPVQEVGCFLGGIPTYRKHGQLTISQLQELLGVGDSETPPDMVEAEDEDEAPPKKKKKKNKKKKKKNK